MRTERWCGLPEYQFEDVETGDRVLAPFSMADAPSIGDIVSVAGRRLRRLFSDCQVNSDPVSGRYPIKSSTLPRWLPGCEHAQHGKERGKPIIQNREHEARIMGEQGYFKGQ